MIKSFSDILQTVDQTLLLSKLMASKLTWVSQVSLSLSLTHLQISQSFTLSTNMNINKVKFQFPTQTLAQQTP